jgi:hypothetical protein
MESRPGMRTLGSQFAMPVDMQTGSPGHLKAFTDLGLHRYALTFCTDRRRHVFTSNGYEHVLRGEEQTSVVARCILGNPLRAGVAEKVEDYPYVGSLAYPMRDLLEGVAKSG